MGYLSLYVSLLLGVKGNIRESAIDWNIRNV